VIVALFGRRRAGNYCVAKRTDADIPGVVDGDNARSGKL
jgi:hypothetical protein